MNRWPIDFVESELVPGFNVKYFRGVFASIFILITEYDMIIFFMYLIVGIFTIII